MPSRTLPPVRPSAAITVKYRAQMQALIDEMHASLVYWLSARYRAKPPELAADASPAETMRAEVRKLTRRWRRRFREASGRLATNFADDTQSRVDRTLATSKILRDAGMTVRFKATAAQNDTFQAVLAEQVGLITNIAEQHLSAVEGAVMRSVSEGRDLGYLTKQLEERAGVTKRRAAFIARDQNNKATAVMTRVRQTELGITKAKWLHSAGGKTPRPEHVAMSGKVYEIAKGAFLEGKWTWPGVELNCRCVSVSVVPGFD